MVDIENFSTKNFSVDSMQKSLIPKLPTTQLASSAYKMKLFQVVWFHSIFVGTPRGVIGNSKREGISMKPNF